MDNSAFNLDNLMNWLTAIFAVYLLFSAFTGKGGLYKNEFVKKESVAQYRHFTKIFALVAGLICAGLAIIGFIGVQNNILVMTIIGVLLVLIVVFIVFTRPMIDTKRRK